MRLPPRSKTASPVVILCCVLYLIPMASPKSKEMADHVFEDESWHIELFGTGLFVSPEKKNVMKHMSSSTEDLIKLFNTEIAVIKEVRSLKATKKLPEEAAVIFDQYVQLVDYDIATTKPEEYVFHPINAFHMLQRTSRFLPRLRKILKNDLTSFKLKLPTETEAVAGAAHGLADIHEYYDMNVTDMAAGNLVDHRNGQVHPAKSNLTSSEIIQVALAAKKVNYLDDWVAWTRAAISAAKAEGKPSKFLSPIKKLLQEAKLEHDKMFNIPNVHKDFMKDIIHIRETPFYPSANTVFNERELKKKTKEMNNLFNNLLKPGANWHHIDLPTRMATYLRRRVQRLCRGTHVRPASHTRHLNCKWLHHDNPYLRLGPFKFEIHHTNPQVAELHDFISEDMTDKVKDEARGKMKATPYVVGDKEEAYSKLRTSKVMYMNEKRVTLMMNVSNRIEKATRYRLTHEQYASENFQVMNYGIGGTINGHLDSSGLEYRTTESARYGGYRLTTFMIYLSDVAVGGHTVFPQAGISVRPVKGSALFWFNAGPQGNFDSRIYHLGCPVLVGNKWIANKWIKWVPNFKSYPCYIDREHFSILDKA